MFSNIANSVLPVRTYFHSSFQFWSRLAALKDCKQQRDFYCLGNCWHKNSRGNTSSTITRNGFGKLLELSLVLIDSSTDIFNKTSSMMPESEPALVRELDGKLQSAF